MKSMMGLVKDRIVGQRWGWCRCGAWDEFVEGHRGRVVEWLGSLVYCFVVGHRGRVVGWLGSLVVCRGGPVALGWCACDAWAEEKLLRLG